ncbi:potassium voltage-gated channel subfamily KQT member 1 [Hydra vulgaris]|uniref:Potassium voltage-gated channel subfamily KQT member 1 n=1 Tax=Hydra vulgaris TaxID=6087 RepID=A0ABM4DAE3_HYDVU
MYLHKFRLNVFYFMERPSSRYAVLYHTLVLLSIMCNAVIGILSTIDVYEKNDTVQMLFWKYEIFMLAVFVAELAVRLIVCGVISNYSGFIGRLVFMKNIYMLADIFIILSTITSIVIKSNDASLDLLRFSKFFQCFQMFRILRLDRRRGDILTMLNILQEHKKELLSSYFVCLNILLFGSYIIYAVEKTHNQSSENRIDNMANGLYWGVITFTSVGYGDYLPKTWAGKILTGIFSAFGCAFFSLPAGIIGSGLAIHVSRQKREKRSMEIKHPACVVIQTAWRIYAINNNLKSTKIQVFSHILYENRMVDDAFKQKIPNFINEKKPRSSTDPIRHEKYSNERNFFKKHKNTNNLIILEEFLENSCFSTVADSFVKKNEITRQYKIAIKFITLTKLFVAIKNFKISNSPYVNVEDFLEKSNRQLTDSARLLKELNRKFDEINKLHIKIDVLIEEMKSLKKTINEIKRVSK